MTMFDGGRSEYTTGKLELKDLNADPIEQLRLWLEEAKNAQVIEPNAMSLATSDANNHPSACSAMI